MKIGAISCCTNYATGITNKELDHKEVIEIANKQTSKFKALLRLVAEHI
jgi:purine nucleoside phosphorylase